MSVFEEQPPIINVSAFSHWLKKNYSFFKSVQIDLLEKIKLGRFDGIILIDYPGFNLRLAKKIKNVENHAIRKVSLLRVVKFHEISNRSVP